MQTSKLSGFVIKYHSFMEANKVITIFSKEKGKVSVVAHGVQKTKSKHGSAFELLNEVTLILNNPNNKTKLYTIKESLITISTHKLKETYQNINILYYMAEFINTFSQEEHSDIEIYNLFRQTINQAIKENDKLYILARAFELKALSIFGFLANIKYCSNCNSMLIKKDGELKPFSAEYYKQYEKYSIYVSKRAGWIFCSKCKNTRTDKKIGLGTYKIILDLNNFDTKQIQNLKINDYTRKEINLAFVKLIVSVIGKSLNSSKLIS